MGVLCRVRGREERQKSEVNHFRGEDVIVGDENESYHCTHKPPYGCEYFHHSAHNLPILGPVQLRGIGRENLVVSRQQIITKR